MHEASLYDSNLFVTLTYAEDKLPSWSLYYRDYMLFMKRLRKKWFVGVSRKDEFSHRWFKRPPIRFFVSGEYGGRTKRPHWHAILFNARFPDQEPFLNDTIRSSMCEQLWGNGNVVIGQVTPQSAAYVAGYTLKKVHGQAAEEYYEDLVHPLTGEVSSRRREFVVMSRRPGIGSKWYEKYGRDCFPGDRAVMEGQEYKVPRYYWKRFEEEGDPAVVEDVAWKRELKALARKADSTPDRRLVREVVAERRAAMFGERGL